MAILIMVSYLRPDEVAKVCNSQFVEIFSGRARTARMAAWSGFRPRAVDFLYSPKLNVLKPAGFMPLI